ncbi:MAG: sugar phosphate isomerase/epimerase family protein [Terriglobia bacterium]
MRVSFCTIAFRHDTRLFPQIVNDVASLGYDGIEIWGGHLEVGQAELDTFGEVLDAAGVDVAMVSPYFDFTGGPAAWDRSLQEGRRYIEVATALGAPLIRVFTGTIGSDRAAVDDWSACAHGLSELCRAAEHRGISLALETHPSTLVDTVDSTLRLIETVNRPNLRVNLDIYHLWEVHQDAVSVLDALGPHVSHVHAKNAHYTREIKGRSPHPFVHDQKAGQDFKGITSLEEGEMDYGPFIKGLARDGFEGFVSIEWFGEDVERAAERELAYVRAQVPAGTVSESSA